MAQQSVPVQIQVPAYLLCAATAPHGGYWEAVLAAAEKLATFPLASVAFRPSLMKIHVPSESVAAWRAAGIDVQRLFEVAVAMVGAHSATSPDPRTQAEFETELATEAAYDGFPLPPDASDRAQEAWKDARGDAEDDGTAKPLRLVANG